MTSHPHPHRPDDLKQRYLQASADQSIGPSERVRLAALAHAQMVAPGSAPMVAPGSAPLPAPALTRKAAANRWNFSLVASVALAGISALLALQFDRSDPQDKAVVLGTPSVTAPAEEAAMAAVVALPKPPLPSAPSAPSAPSNAVPIETLANSRSKNQAEERTADPAAKGSSKPSAKTAAAVKEQSIDMPARTTPASRSPPMVSPATTAPPLKMDAESAAESARSRPALPDAPAVTGITGVTAPSAAPAMAQSRASVLADTEFNSQPNARPDAAKAGAPVAAMKSRSAAAPGASVDAAPATAQVANPSAALRHAARSGQITLLEQALQQASPAQVNAPDDKGRTPLMLATLGNHIGAVQRLLTAGADPSLKDADGRTAAQMAQQGGYTVISNILIKQPVAQ